MKIEFSKRINSNRFILINSLMLIVCLSIFISSCCKKDEEPSPPPEIIREISEEIKDLIYFKGDEKASVVLINVQSGPDIELSTGEVDTTFAKFDTTDILRVNVHQAQTLNPSIGNGDEITLAQAVQFNAESVDMLHQVIEYFKEQDRTVYVFGGSFGAFVTQELIAKKGIDVADKYLIMIGRLDINDIMWKGLAEGRYGYFENGITPVLFDEPTTDLIEINLGRIAAGFGMNRYTQRLNSVGDLSKVTYVYGATDEFVGSLTAEEIEFLESKNANVIRGSGGHDDTFNDYIAQGFSEAFGIE